MWWRGGSVRAGVARLTLCALALAAMSIRSAVYTPTSPSDRIWFCPDPGTLDYLASSSIPTVAEGPERDERLQVLPAAHADAAARLVGPNTYDALVAVGAFRQADVWSNKIALEAGSVKEFCCTPDASGMDQSIRDARLAQRGRRRRAERSPISRWTNRGPPAERRCGGPALEPTADRVATYMSAVQSAYPGVCDRPHRSVPLFERRRDQRSWSCCARAARRRCSCTWTWTGTAWRRRLCARHGAAAACRADQISPSASSSWGYNGDADALYALDAAGIANLIADAFQTWDAMPQHLIVQSWVGLEHRPVDHAVEPARRRSRHAHESRVQPGRGSCTGPSAGPTTAVPRP